MTEEIYPYDPSGSSFKLRLELTPFQDIDKKIFLLNSLQSALFILYYNMPQEAVIYEDQIEDQITEDELLKISSSNPNMQFELVKGELVTMPPVGDYSGELECEYLIDVGLWCRKNKAKCRSPSTGFKLPNGDIRSADVAVILPDNPNYVKKKKRKKYFPGAPDFLIEIRSESDSLKELKSKMENWINNGCKLAFLIDQLKRKSYVYRKDGSVTEYPYTAKLSGEDVLPGFFICPAEIDPE